MAGPPNNPIERLMIYHTGLLPPGGLDESASLTELGENILYYFDSATMATSTAGACTSSGMENGNKTSTEEAIKFLGLVTALHSLPLNLSNAIRSGEGEMGRNESESNIPTNSTHQVHLVHSTLVFVPLEEEYDRCNGLVAVAQIPRAGSGIDGSDNSNENSAAVVNGGDPVSIRAMIQRKHSAFCLLRGGSVHLRLSSFDEAKFNQQVLEGDAIINRPSPRASSATNAADRNRRDAARAASVAAAEAVAQGDAAWMERWGHTSIGETDDMQNDDGKNARANHNTSDSTITSLAKRGGRSDVAVSLLRQQSGFALSVLDHAGGDNVDAAEANESYPGIAMLYKYRKELRKLSERLTASQIDVGLYDSSKETDDATKIGILEEKVAAAQERINTLLTVLPLGSLRRDLEAYYGNVVASAGTICALLAGQSVGRCVVDLIPSPGLSWPPSPSCPPNEPPPSTAAMLNRIAQTLLGRRDVDLAQRSLMHVDPVNVSTESARNDAPLLLGISSFYKGQFLFSNISSELHEDRESRTSMKLSKDMVSIIHRHFFRGCVGEENKKQGSHGPNDAGSFVSPPRVLPSFDTLGYEVVESIFILSLGDIWLPRVKLPLCGDENRGIESEILARVALFKYDAYEFLIFLNGDEFVAESVTLSGPVTTGVNTSLPICTIQVSESAITVLTSLSRQLQDVLQRMPILYPDRVYEGEPGSNVVYVDRLANKVVLFSSGGNHADKARDPNNGPVDNGAVVTRGNEIDFGMRPCREFLMSSDDDLDCRHLLASRLPLDIVLALDEMMKEVRQSSSHQKTEGGVHAGGSRVVELCTFLPQGWVFCRAHEHRELFGVFDPNVYVTLADVQKATMRIRRELGGVIL